MKKNPFIYDEATLEAQAESVHFGPAVDLTERWGNQHNRIPSVLDVGCASGSLAQLFKLKGIKVNYIGLDLSSSFFHDDLKKSKRISFIQGDVLTLPFKNNVFDIVICYGTLYTIPYQFQARGLKELLRVSKHACIANFLGVPPGENSVLRRAGPDRDHFITMRNELHWRDFIRQNGLPDPQKSISWSARTNRQGTYPVYRGCKFRVEQIYVWMKKT